MSEIDFTIQSGAMTEMYSFFPLYPIWIPQQVQSVLTSRRIPFLPFIPSTTTSRIQGNTASTLKLIIPFNLLTWSSAYYPGLSLHISTQGTFFKKHVLLLYYAEMMPRVYNGLMPIKYLDFISSHFFFSLQSIHLVSSSLCSGLLLYPPGKPFPKPFILLTPALQLDSNHLIPLLKSILWPQILRDIHH